MPLWLGAGLADWYIHRRTRIEDTAGARESAIHALMFAETGVPVLLGLFCEVNASVLLSAYGAAGVHGATAYWDQVYAQPRRQVDPVEQHVHSLLEARSAVGSGPRPPAGRRDGIRDPSLRRGAMAVLARQADHPAVAAAGRPGHPDPVHPARRRHPIRTTTPRRNCQGS